MGWRPKGKTATRFPAHGFKPVNRECAHCVFPCTGGEVLHKRGHCCRSFCPCTGFEPKAYSSSPGLPEVLLRKAGMGRGPEH